MNRIARAVIAGTMVAGALSGPALATEKLTGEEKLAKILEGREPGKPVSCIPLNQANNSRVIDKTAIVYDVGNTLYVNRPTNADSLDSDDILVTKLTGSQLCRLDVVNLRDRGSMMFSGFVGLQDFIPYRKVAAKD